MDLQRAGIDPRQRLHLWASQGQIYQCGVIRSEFLRGLRRPDVRDAMEAFFDVLPEIPTDARLWRETSELAWQLDRAGKILPLTDLVIASCAIRIGATVISPDRHFQNIESLQWREDLPERP